MGSLLVTAHNIILNVVGIYSILLVIYILMSWVPSTRETGFGRFLGKLAEPYLGFFRRFIPPLGMIDISPIVALLALQFISKGITAIFQMILNMLYGG